MAHASEDSKLFMSTTEITSLKNVKKSVVIGKRKPSESAILQSVQSN